MQIDPIPSNSKTAQIQASPQHLNDSPDYMDEDDSRGSTVDIIIKKAAENLNDIKTNEDSTIQ